MAVLAPPVQVVASGAPPFVQVSAGAPPFVVTTGPAPPIQIVASGAPPITLFNEDGSIWSSVIPGGGALLVGEANGFATDFTYATDASRVAVKVANVTTNYAVDTFYTQSGTSPKMVYDASGVLGWSPHNMLIYSQDLTNTTGWGPNNVTVSSATRLVETAVTSSHSIPANTTPVTIVGAPYCFWVEATAAECDRIMLYGLSLTGQGLGFDLTNGTTFTVNTIPNVGLLSSGMLALGGGRYRCWISVTAGGSTGNGALYMVNGTVFSYAGSTSRGVTIHCQQMNRGTVPTAYLPTTTAARVGLALDYDPVTHAAKGMLVEPAATNLAKQSQTFDNASWTKENCTVVANAAVAPDGTTTADKLVEAAVTGPHDLGQIATATTGMVSVYAKAAERSRIMFYDNIAVKGDGFDLAAGSIFVASGIPATGGAIIQNVGNGWWRCAMPTAAMTTVTIYTCNGTAYSYAGDGASGAYIWGAQLESGAVATSYIPTTTATVTRAADQVNVTPASIGHSGTAGSWWVDMEVLPGSDNGRVIGCGGINNPPLYIQTSTQFALFDTAPLAKIITSTLGRRKFMSAYQASDRAITADGLTATTDAGATAGLLAPATITIGTGAGATVNAYIRKLRYLPRRPSNAELQTMTT